MTETHLKRFKRREIGDKEKNEKKEKKE